jgi:hypothetical protein
MDGTVTNEVFLEKVEGYLVLFADEDELDLDDDDLDDEKGDKKGDEERHG